MSPVLLIVGVAASAWLFQVYSVNAGSWGPLVRFAIVGVIGMLVVIGCQLKGLEHHGPGTLGAMAIHGLYFAVGILVLAGLGLKFGLDIFKLKNP
ncbi:MAG: hypothetical protein EOP06_30155 [Proteobacteria bacterium]|nr:MAG: hypothetical protein EOP06_30155 [Pseudomonadota bacterium]